MKTLITENIDIWTTAIKKRSATGRGSNKKIELTGIKKLRELIFELAVRGKLVPQESCDEPASELLERLTDKKSLIAKSGKFSELKTNKVLKLDGLFEIPNTWTWCHLDDIAAIARGGSPRPIKSFITDSEDGLNWIKIGDSNRGSRYITGTEQKIIKEGLVKTRQVYPGDLILSNSMSFGFPYILKISGCIHDGWLVIRIPEEDLNKIFLCNLFMSTYAKKAFTDAASGAVVQNLNADKVKLLAIPLPPLPEQHRIVAKVDELMALCDQLEQQTENSLTAHQTLVETLLATLTNSENAAAFQQNWARIAEHFDTLFTTEHSIDQLKQTVLQLAVMGKLVPQNPNDEPASKLLNQLEQEQKHWLMSNIDNDPECKTMLRKLKKLTYPKAPYALPNSWSCAHLIQLSQLLVDCHNKTAPYVDSGIPIIRTTNIRDREFSFDGLKFVNQETYDFWSRRCPPAPRDIMFTREAPMGEAAIIPDNVKWCLGQRTMLIRPMHEYVSNAFLLLTLTEPHLLERASEHAVGLTVKHLRVGDVENISIPFPPLPEQHRIVKKVDELLTLCDQLKARLNDAQTTQLNLAETLVKQTAN